MATSFRIESSVRGHHIYKSTWTPEIGEELAVTMEEDNSFDSYAVAVAKNSSVVGHLPREISRISWFFLQKRQSKITCVVTAGRKRSTIRGKGLVVPCVYIFKGKTKHLEKLISLIRTIELEH